MKKNIKIVDQIDVSKKVSLFQIMRIIYGHWPLTTTEGFSSERAGPLMPILDSNLQSLEGNSTALAI